MQLRQRLELLPETVSDFAAASEQKYWEGLELATAGHGAAGIYLLGYAAETLLKIASFRFEGAATSDLVSPRLAPAKIWMRSQPANVPHEGFHSILFWTAYLRARRSAAGASLDSNVDGQLVHHTKRIYSCWWVEMRYRPDSATPGDVQQMFSDVTWLRDNQLALWRQTCLLDR